MEKRLLFIIILPTVIFAWCFSLLFSIYQLPSNLSLENAKSLHYQFEVNRENPPPPGKDLDRVFWWIHMSDIHVSKFHDLNRAEDLKRFCKSTLKWINPEFVLVTGDLTDAKDEYQLTSIQYEDEWKTYAEILEYCGNVPWLDLPGNHDTFNVPSLEHKSNFFKTYSSQKNSSYTHILEKPYGKYRFIAVDATPSPGSRRPFNFFGVLEKRKMNDFEAKLQNSEKYNHTVVFGHYPLSLINSFPSSSGRTLSQLTRRFTLYLCGHLHTLLDFALNMHVRHKDGSAELEVGDWKDNRRFRVMAFDHDLFSFADVKHDEWPIIILTNPKNAKFTLDAHEPLEIVKDSTHIRVLIFSSTEIKSVTVEILDSAGVNLVFSARAEMVENGPLWVAKWDAKEFSTGLHTIVIRVEALGFEPKTLQQKFSLDGSFDGISIVARLLLLTNFSFLLKIIFYSFYTVIIVGMLILPKMLALHYQKINKLGIVIRHCHSTKETPRNSNSHSHSHQLAIGMRRESAVDTGSDNRLSLYAKQIFAKLLALSAVPKLSNPLIAYGIYILVGPWFIGEMLEDGSWGVFFVHGLLLNSTFIPESVTFWYATMQLLTGLLPLLSALLGRIPIKSEQLQLPASNMSVISNVSQGLQMLFKFVLYSFFAWYQLASCYALYNFFGWSGLVFSPAKLGFVILATILLKNSRSWISECDHIWKVGKKP